jgi:hypothetical protein
VAANPGKGAERSAKRGVPRSEGEQFVVEIIKPIPVGKEVCSNAPDASVTVNNDKRIVVARHDSTPRSMQRRRTLGPLALIDKNGGDTGMCLGRRDAKNAEEALPFLTKTAWMRPDERTTKPA